MSAAAFQTLIRRFKSDPPKGSRETALRLQEIWELYPTERRKAIIAKHRYQHFPELPMFGRQHLRVLNMLLKAEEAGLEVEACWEALDRRVSFSDVRRALGTAKNHLLANPKLDFAVELKTLLSRKKRYVTETENAPVKQPAKKGKARKRQGKRLAHWRNVAEVMGSRVLNVQQVIETLTQRGQMPESRNPGGYISLILSTTKDSKGRLIFERVKRGHYRLAAAHAEGPTTPQASKPAAVNQPAAVEPAPPPPPPPPPRPVQQPKPITSSRRPPEEPMPIIGEQWREWIIQRSKRLRITQQEFVDQFFLTDMQHVLSKAQRA